MSKGPGRLPHLPHAVQPVLDILLQILAYRNPFPLSITCCTRFSLYVLGREQFKQLPVPLGEDAAFAPQEGDIMALLKILQGNSPQKPLSQLRLSRSLIEKSHPAAQQQQFFNTFMSLT